MKQGLRFVVRPQTFFNQLQWSSNHWMFMLAFLAVAFIETQLGAHNQIYHAFANSMYHQWGVTPKIALWIVTFAKLTVMVIAALALSSLIYVVGSLVGQKNSRRVLFRRLSVVFTVLLAGFSVSHFAYLNPALVYLSWALYAWGALLGFFAIREQFSVGFLEATILSVFALLLIGSTWKVSNQYFETSVRKQMSELTLRGSSTDSKIRLGGDR